MQPYQNIHNPLIVLACRTPATRVLLYVSVHIEMLPLLLRHASTFNGLAVILASPGRHTGDTQWRMAGKGAGPVRRFPCGRARRDTFPAWRAYHA